MQKQVAIVQSCSERSMSIELFDTIARSGQVGGREKIGQQDESKLSMTITYFE